MARGEVTVGDRVQQQEGEDLVEEWALLCRRVRAGGRATLLGPSACSRTLSQEV